MNKLLIQNITVSAEGKEVVRDVSLELASGEVHVLMGANGSGKSSFVNALLGHPKYTVSKGSITLDNEDITELATDKKARLGLFLSMQYIPEIEGVGLSKFLFQAYKHSVGGDLSVLDFYKKLKVTAESLGIDETLVDREVNKGLSGGEKKQSELLQLSVLEPKFAFLDEIDSGVDMDSLKKIFNGIEVLRKQGVGFLLITHYDKILDHISPNAVHVMKQGSLVRSGGKELVEQIKNNGFQTI